GPCLGEWSGYLFAIVVVSVALCAAADDQDARAPEAAPLITILEAAKVSDLATFKSAYSRRIRDDQGQADWPKNLDEARTNLTRMFGDYRLGSTISGFRSREARNGVESRSVIGAHRSSISPSSRKTVAGSSM